MNHRSQLIICLLQQLHAVHPNKLKVLELHVGAGAMGFSQETPESITSLLSDCVEKDLVTQDADPFDGSVKRYARTETARVLLLEHGHI